MADSVKYHWVDTLLQEIAAGKQYRRLIQQCIDNMDNKKLYKYYDLASQYTLPNILNSQNFYSNPVSFNDPFDCNIGISADQLMRLFSSSLYDQLYGSTLDPAVHTMLDAVMYNDVSTYDDGSNEAIITACLECPDIANLICQAQSGEQIDDSCLAEALMKNPDILALMLSKYPNIMKRANQRELAEQIMLVVTKSTNFLRQIINQAAADQPEETKDILSIMSEDEDLLKRLQKVARLLGYADQDNQIKQLYDQLENVVKQMHTKIGEVIGITCFTETPDNMLMWSHYANKHTGICVEYDFATLFTTAPNTLLLPVTYTTKRPLFPIEKMATGADGKVANEHPLPSEVLPELIKAFTTKSNVWNYEREWRHIMFTNTASNRIVRLPIISKIIMGVNISPDQRAQVIALAKQKHIPVYAAHMKADKYQVIIKKLME